MDLHPPGPAHARWATRPLGAFVLVAVAVAVLGAGACAGEPPPPAGPPPHRTYWENSPKVCGVDEVREYHCEELLPLRSALPAPYPYTNCPGQIEDLPGKLDPRPTVAAFDVSYTAYIRRRMPPGHSCCYSWCARIPLADATKIDPQARCRDVLAMRETFWFDEPEKGTTDPSNPPYERCPRAIVPPAGEVFFQPPGALFDPVCTAGWRRLGLGYCCYSWCSRAPPGSGLQGR